MYDTSTPGRVQASSFKFKRSRTSSPEYTNEECGRDEWKCRQQQRASPRQTAAPTRSAAPTRGPRAVHLARRVGHRRLSVHSRGTRVSCTSLRAGGGASTLAACAGRMRRSRLSRRGAADDRRPRPARSALSRTARHRRSPCQSYGNAWCGTRARAQAHCSSAWPRADRVRGGRSSVDTCTARPC